MHRQTMKLKIRISRSFTELNPKEESFITKLAEVCDVLVVYEHEADDEISRTHIHCYADNPRVSTDTMKNWVKKALGVTKFVKTDWSFPEAQDEGFITYMSKGHLDPLFIKGITADACTLLKAQWVEIPKAKGKTQYILRVENPAQQKLRQSEMVDEIRRRIHANPPPDDYDMTAIVIQHILDVVVKENKTVCGRYKVRDYYDTVMSLEANKRHMKDLELFCRYRS